MYPGREKRRQRELEQNDAWQRLDQLASLLLCLGESWKVCRVFCPHVCTPTDCIHSYTMLTHSPKGVLADAPTKAESPIRGINSIPTTLQQVRVSDDRKYDLRMCVCNV